MTHGLEKIWHWTWFVDFSWDVDLLCVGKIMKNLCKDNFRRNISNLTCWTAKSAKSAKSLGSRSSVQGHRVTRKEAKRNVWNSYLGLVLLLLLLSSWFQQVPICWKYVENMFQSFPCSNNFQHLVTVATLCFPKHLDFFDLWEVICHPRLEKRPPGRHDSTTRVQRRNTSSHVVTSIQSHQSHQSHFTAASHDSSRLVTTRHDSSRLVTTQYSSVLDHDKRRANRIAA